MSRKKTKEPKHHIAYESLTQRQWLALAWLLFKTTDKLDWAIVCPSCFRTWTVRAFRDSGQDVECAFQQCIDREAMCRRDTTNLPKGRCDWAAFGLFRGPWIVVIDDEDNPGQTKEVATFPFLGATKEKVQEARDRTDELYAEAKEHQRKMDGVGATT